MKSAPTNSQLTEALRQFHNALRILCSIDRHEMEVAGINVSDASWKAFNDNPWKCFIRCDDDTAEKLWGIIQARQPLQ